MTAALALLLSSLAFAGGTGEVGGGVGPLIPGAMRAAQHEWGDDVCLEAVYIRANIEFNCKLPGERPGAVDFFEFRMLKPQRRYDESYVELNQAETVPPECVVSPGPPPLNEMKPWAGMPTYSFDRACLSGMKVDSPTAIGTAVRAGLGAGRAYEALLAEAAGPGSGFWKVKELRKKTFWQVANIPDRYEKGPQDVYIVDAMTGKLLMKRKGFVKFSMRMVTDEDVSR